MVQTISDILDRISNAPDILDAIPELERFVRWERIGSRNVRGDRAECERDGRKFTFSGPGIGGCDFNRTTPDQQILRVMVQLPTVIYGWEILMADPEFANRTIPGWVVFASEVNRETWNGIRTFLEDVASDPDRSKGSGWMKW